MKGLLSTDHLFRSLLFFLAVMAAPQSVLEARAWLERSERIQVDLSADLVTLEGKTVNIRDFEEKVLMVNFWATWCGPCRAEMPSMGVLHRRLSGESFRILAVTDEDPQVVRAFLDRDPYEFTILLDRSGALSERLRIFSIPFTLILDSRRRLVHFHQGARLWDTPDVLNNLKQVLSE